MLGVNDVSHSGVAYYVQSTVCNYWTGVKSLKMVFQKVIQIIIVMTILMIFQAETYLIVFCQRSKDFIHKNLGMLVHYLEESFQYLNAIEITK